MTVIQELQRRIELETELLDLESRQKQIKKHIPELKSEKQAADSACLEYENSSLRRFFDKLSGKQEEKRENFSRAASSAAAALDGAQRELAATEEKLAAVQKEMSGMRDWNMLMEEVDPGKREHFLRVEASLCAEAALNILRENKKALEEAMRWARPDTSVDPVGAGYRKNRCLSEASELANQCHARLKRIARCSILLEEHPYFTNPSGYITGVAARYEELDRMNSALTAIRETEKQLRELILQLTE